MKIEYRNITGILDNNSYYCHDCCFYNLIRCLPSHIHRCRSYVFKGVKTQIFDL